MKPDLKGFRLKKNFNIPPEKSGGSVEALQVAAPSGSVAAHSA